MCAYWSICANKNEYGICMLQEFAPSDEELLAYRKDEEWAPEKAKRILKQRVSTNKCSLNLLYGLNIVCLIIIILSVFLLFKVSKTICVKANKCLKSVWFEF